ncbi:hypothetical protein Tco_0773915 [Tanacetum coccineum]|uniref:Retrotransposon gag domain-containing protein n=1 Tax=Tanacetum coccineum TaxID=301880 RepID=A0ABQ4ZM08_9ASTR
MAEPIPEDYIYVTRKNFLSGDNEGRMVKKSFLEIQGIFLVKIRDNAFNGTIKENAVEHIENFLEVVEPLKIKGVSHDRFRLSVFPISLSSAASEWFKKQCIGSVTTWEDLVEKFVQKFHRLCYNNEEMEVDEDDNSKEMNIVAEIFKNGGNLFDYEIPLCKEFDEFNYLLKIDTDLFTFDVQKNVTYMDYEYGMMSRIVDIKNEERDYTNSPKISKFKIGDEFLKILRDNAFNGMDGGDIINHITKVLEILEWIKIPNVDQNQLRLHVFPISLSGDAKKWWNNEIEGTVTTWNKLGEKFFHKYYPLSHTCNSKIPDDLDNGTDYFEFLYWLESNFKNHWEIDKNTENGLWEFYVKQCTKGSISDLEPSKDECDKLNEIYNFEESNKDFSPIPIPTHSDISNLDELCKSKEFMVVRYSIGSNEEFITVSPSKCNTWGKPHGTMSCIYHDLFNKKDHGWTITHTK